jgi:hypothetical protein
MASPRMGVSMGAAGGAHSVRGSQRVSDDPLSRPCRRQGADQVVTSSICHRPPPFAMSAKGTEGRKAKLGSSSYFLLRRCTRVRLSSLRCFFLAMRLRRFLMTEPTTTLAHDWNHSVRGVRAHTTYVGQDYLANRNGCNPAPTQLSLPWARRARTSQPEAKPGPGGLRGTHIAIA